MNAKSNDKHCIAYLQRLATDIGSDNPRLDIAADLIDQISMTVGTWDFDENVQTHFLDRWFDYPDVGRKLRVIRLASDGMIHFDVDLNTYGLEPLLTKHMKHRTTLVKRLNEIPSIDMPEDVESHRVIDLDVFSNDKSKTQLLDAYKEFQDNLDDLVEL